MISVCIILFGLLIGSFLNVVIHRLPRDQSVVRPRSSCVNCKTMIAGYDNLPLISYLFLRGKCRHCKTTISARYPLIEFLTAVLFWFSWRGMGVEVLQDFGLFISQLRIWFFISICIAIAFIDLDFRIIPDELSIGGWILGLITCYWDFRNDWLHLVLASFAGFGVFLVFGLVYEKITGRVGLGGGDIKFMGTIGVFLGLGGIASSLLISSILGSVIGIAYAYYQQKIKKSQGSEAGGLLQASIPYGPFLVLGALSELFFEVSAWMNG
jgi:leader peptidase (prepilin peptidase)/N-methyltransferase